MTGVSAVFVSVWSGVVLFPVSHYWSSRTGMSCGMGGRLQSTGGGGGEASPPSTQASPPNIFSNVI